MRGGAVRVVAVVVPHFSIVAHRRRDADLRRRPLVLVEGGRQTVVACSPDAVRRGISPGMSRSAAVAACGEAALLPLDAAYCKAEHVRVREALAELAPEVEDEALGAWSFHAAGLERLHGTEPRLVTATRRRVLAVGYASRVAAATGRFTALAAARFGRGDAACVPDGHEAEMLAPLPIEAAMLDAAAAKRLRMLGVYTLGDLARLPEEGVRTRFGDAGVHAQRLARGLDPTPLAPRSAPAAAQSEVAFDPPAEMLDEVLFRVRVLCDDALDQLAARALACWEARLELELDGAEPLEVALRLARPTLSARALWTLLRLRLERIELEGPVTRARLAVVDAPPARAEQRELFRALRDTEQLEAVIERLRARFGPDAALSPLLVEVHRPEARVAWRGYRIDEEPRGPCSTNDLPSGRVLRLLTPPQPLTAEEREGRIVCFTGTGLSCQVARISQPYRLSGEWWDDEYARDYYIVLARDGRLLWVFRAHGTEAWYVQGEFD